MYKLKVGDRIIGYMHQSINSLPHQDSFPMSDQTWYEVMGMMDFKVMHGVVVEVGELVAISFDELKEQYGEDADDCHTVEFSERGDDMPCAYVQQIHGDQSPWIIVKL
jgi:hypothetical protein